MFVTKSQFYIFLICFSFGAIFGIFFSLINMLYKIIKNKIIGNILYVGFFVIMALVYIPFAIYMDFPYLRVYMVLAIFIGIVTYMKSFNIILAKFGKKFYNKYVNKKGNTKDGRSKV